MTKSLLPRVPLVENREAGEKSTSGRDMASLAEFITKNIDEIINEWENFAKTLAPMGTMSPRALIDHSREILIFVTKDMATQQSDSQQLTKSHSETEENLFLPDTAAETHGALRLESGFDINEMVSEYRALRASVIRLWLKESQGINDKGLQDLIRFNEAIDQALIESIRRYAKNLDASKNLLLGILGHDLRNPIGVIATASELLARNMLNEKQEGLVKQINKSASRAVEIITNLADLTRSQLGAGIPVTKEMMNFRNTTQEIIEEMRVLHPTTTLVSKLEGTLIGYGDAARIKQVLSNLVGNAIQYGEKDRHITIAAHEHKNSITLSVHNEGPPIPDSQIDRIFDSLVRLEDPEMNRTEASGNLGLGLYIANMIVKSHDGELSVTSTAREGTTFYARFPTDNLAV